MRWLILLLFPGLVFAGGIKAPDLPNLKETPGVVNPDITQDNINQTICNPHWSTKSIRPPTSYTNKIKRYLLAKSGYEDQKLEDYELDHDISIELAGHPSDIRNFWLEHYSEPWGARTKDKLENRLHKLVCQGKITLKQAQKEISTNWIKAYKKYIGPNP